MDNAVVLFLIFWGNSMLFSIVAASIYIPTNNVQGFPFLLHSPQYLLSFIFLMITILPGTRWYLIVVLIYISLMISDVVHFSCTSWSFVYLLWKNVYSALLPILKSDWFFFLFSHWIVWILLYIFQISTPIKHMICKMYSLPFYKNARLPFHFVDGFLCCAEAF